MRPAGLTDPGPIPICRDYVKIYEPLMPDSQTDGHLFPMCCRFGSILLEFSLRTQQLIDEGEIEREEADSGFMADALFN